MNKVLRRVSIVILVAAVAVAYHNTLHSPFLFDDIPNIVDNENNHLSRLDPSSLEKLFPPARATGARIFAHLTFAANYFFGGLDPFGYHLLNISIHILNAILLFHLFAWYFRQDAGMRDRAEYPALLCALLWAASPLQVTAVTYVVQRMTSLSVLFTLSSLLLYLHGRQFSSLPRQGTIRHGGYSYFALSFGCWVLALLSKEIAVILPVIILLHEVYFFQSLSLAGLARSKKYLLPAALPLFILSLSSLPYLWDFIQRGYEGRPFTPVERLLTQARVVVYYFSLYLYPDPERLMLYHDFPLSRSLFNPMTTLFSIGAIISLVALSLRFRLKARLASFGILWTLSCLLLESSILPLEMVFEHRFYLPSVGLTLALAGSLFPLAARIRWREMLICFVCLLVIGLQIFWTHRRNQVWATELAFALDAVKKTPRLPRALNHLAGVYIRAGDLESGRQLLERALFIVPEDIVILANLYLLQEEMGRTVQADASLVRLRQSISDGNFHCLQRNALMKVAVNLMKQRQYNDILFIYKKLEQCRPELAVIYDNMAIVYEQQGDLLDAAGYYEKALRREPGNFEYAMSLTRAYFLLGDWNNARRVIRAIDTDLLSVKQKKELSALEQKVHEYSH
jgi:tetratricopeptide (TPR) repeat protein